MSRRLAQSRFAALAVAVAASVASIPLYAQTAPTTEPDTIYFGQRRGDELPKFWVAPMGALLELRSTYTNTEVSTEGIPDQHITETLFQETLTLFSHGYVVHPNLVDFRFSLTGGLSQNFIDTNGVNDNSNGTIYGWDIAATAFRTQPGNLTVYTRRNESMNDIPFGPTQRTITSRTGAIWNYQGVDSTVRLEAFHEEEDQSAFGPNDNDFSLVRDAFIGSGDWQITQNQLLNWSFELEQTTYDSGGEDTERTIAGGVDHSVSFGDDLRSALSSGISFHRTENSLDREEFRWTEHLHLQHNTDFETNYDTLYQHLSYGSAETDHYALGADARHQLYKSLTTVGRIRWDEVTSGDNTTDTTLADLSLNYRKNVPNGIFLADGRVGYSLQQISGSSQIYVADQPIAFVGLDPVTVSQQNAIPASVLIRDAVSGRTYTQGIDYTVQTTPLGLEIDRVLGGNIPAGQPLLLSYDYVPPDANEIGTTSYGLGTRYQFTKGPLAGFAPYARFFGQDQDVSGGDAVPNNVRDYIVGADYQYRGLTLRAEREWYDSTLYPYDAWRYEARIMHSISSETTLNGAAIYSDTQYHEPVQESKSYSFAGSVTHRLTTKLALSGYLSWAHVDSEPGGATEGFEQGFEANWQYRDTKVYMRLRNSTLNSEVTEQDFQFFQVGLQRTF